MIDVVMPQMGESIVEGTLTKWLKKPGEHVDRDEPLFEISTDKVDTEIPSPTAGTLSEVLVEEGKTVSINKVVARIEEGGNGRAPRPKAAEAAYEAEQAAAVRRELEKPGMVRCANTKCGKAVPKEARRCPHCQGPGPSY